jgi:hypothetical protein
MDDGMFNFLTLRHADKVAVGTGTARNVVGIVCAGDDRQHLVVGLGRRWHRFSRPSA